MQFLIEHYGKKKLIAAAVALVLVITAAAVIPILVMNGSKDDASQSNVNTNVTPTPTPTPTPTHTHVLVMTEEKAATCTAEGNHAYYTCATCGKVYADQTAATETTVEAQTVAKLAHDFSSFGHDDWEHWEACAACNEPKSEERTVHVLNDEHTCACGARFKLEKSPLGDGEYIECLFNVNGDAVWEKWMLSDGSVDILREYRRDENGNVIWEKNVYPKEEMTDIYTYVYGEFNEKIKETYESYLGEFLRIEEENTYVDGVLSESFEIYYEDDGSKTEYRAKYDENEQVIEETITEYENGVVTSTSKVTSEYGEDGNISKAVYYDGNGVVDSIVLYTYNPDGTSKQTEYWGETDVLKREVGMDRDELTLYDNYYDENGVLLRKFEYKYDEDGNCIEQIQNDYDENGELSFVHKEELVYGENGNVIEETVTQYDENNVVIYESNRKDDENGNVIEKSYNIYENGILSGGNKTKYGENGNIIEATDTIYENGILSQFSVTKYDENGKFVEEKYQRYANGEMVINKVIINYSDELRKEIEYWGDTDVLMIEMFYDKVSGAPVRYIHYNESGEVTTTDVYSVDDEGFEKLTEYWGDTDVLKSEVVYYADGSVKNRKTYDENGVLIESVEYNEDGSLIA